MFNLTLFFAWEESCSSGANSIAFSELVPTSPEKTTGEIQRKKIMDTECVLLFLQHKLIYKLGII